MADDIAEPASRRGVAAGQLRACIGCMERLEGEKRTVRQEPSTFL